MDADYGRNRDRDGAPTEAFDPSLFVWATVTSRPTEDRAIVDAGLKALAFDSGPPLVCDKPAATYERASDGQVLVVDPEVGHWVRFVVTRVPVSPEKPHGIDYSLTLHRPDGEGWQASTMPIRSAGASVAKRRTIAIGCGRSGCTNTATRRPFSPTF